VSCPTFCRSEALVCPALSAPCYISLGQASQSCQTLYLDYLNPSRRFSCCTMIFSLFPVERLETNSQVESCCCPGSRPLRPFRTIWVHSGGFIFKESWTTSGGIPIWLAVLVADACDANGHACNRGGNRESRPPPLGCLGFTLLRFRCCFLLPVCCRLRQEEKRGWEAL